MSAIAQPSKYWIQSPASDLVFFSFGWIVVFLPLLIFEEHLGLIILIVLLVNYIHRHYTFALVYGQKEEFEKRKRIYILLPLIAALVTIVCIYVDAFKILLTLSVLWTMYHSVYQKYGITRVYSRKAGYGEAWIEKGVIFSWFVYLFFGLADKEKGTILKYQAGRVIMDYIGPYMNYLTALSYFFLAVAVSFTLLFAYQEFKNRHRISTAKVLYVISTLSLYFIFFHSLIVGYIVFAFSHALEYIVFVNVFVNSKYRKKQDSDSLFGKISKKQWLYSGLFSTGIVLLCLLGMELNENAFTIYIVGSSFLHFIYDGLIWKVRRPEVGQPLDIKYAST
jgi:hypothetical protein